MAPPLLASTYFKYLQLVFFVLSHCLTVLSRGPGAGLASRLGAAPPEIPGTVPGADGPHVPLQAALEPAGLRRACGMLPGEP